MWLRVVTSFLRKWNIMYDGTTISLWCTMDVYVLITCTSLKYIYRSLRSKQCVIMSILFSDRFNIVERVTNNEIFTMRVALHSADTFNSIHIPWETTDKFFKHGVYLSETNRLCMHIYIYYNTLVNESSSLYYVERLVERTSKSMSIVECLLYKWYGITLMHKSSLYSKS